MNKREENQARRTLAALNAEIARIQSRRELLLAEVAGIEAELSGLSSDVFNARQAASALEALLAVPPPARAASVKAEADGHLPGPSQWPPLIQQYARSEADAEAAPYRTH